MTWDQGNYIYTLFGGSYSDTSGDSRHYFWRYDISSDSWEQLENTPSGQGAGDAITWVPGSAVGTSNDWVYAIVGSKVSEHGIAFYRYNINTNNWQTLQYNPSWATEGSDDGSSLVWAGGDYLYSLQGEHAESDPADDRAFARFDITDNSWTDLDDIPEEGGVGDGGSLAWAGGNYSNKVYALGGGFVGRGETPGDNFYVYDTSVDNWTQLQSLPYGMTGQNGPRLGYADGSLYCWRGYYDASNNPDVLMAYELPAVGVSVSISPSENNALNGENVTFTVTVTNVDDEHHNFVLENSDSLDWQMSLSEDNLSLDPDNSENVVLEVAIPPAVSGGTEDTVTVTATAQDNAEISSSAGCTAGAQVDVDFNVWITPFSQTGSREDNLDYVVHVKNSGNVVDNYDLIITDNAGWADNVSLAGSGYSDADNIFPSADAGICEYYPNTTKGGDNYNVYVGYENNPYKPNCTGEDTRALFKFDLSGIPDGATITGATLNAHGDFSPSTGFPNYNDRIMLTDVQPLGSDSWGENTVNWNNKPSFGSTLDSVLIDDNEYWSWNVKSAVQNEVSGDGVVSLGLLSENAVSNQKNVTMWFHTKDGSPENPDSVKPYLEVLYEVYDVVSLKNISPGENENVALNVTIPNSAASGDHTVKVGATSYGDDSLSKENSCIASVGSPTGVGVSISPSEDNAPPGYGLNYEVTVTNTGSISDNYDLSVVDNAVPSWNPTLDNSLFEDVPPGENRNTVLRVTVPENANLGVEDNIIVTASSQENVEMDDNASCIALSAALFRSVKISVSPSYKAGSSGSSLDYSVKVKNRGNIPDNYELEASDDVFPSWDPTVVDNIFLNVVPEEERVTTLNVVIPENDNLRGIEDNITTTVTSLENDSVHDSAVCTAQAMDSISMQLDLVADWNLVGLPVVSDSTTKENLFEGTGVDPLSV
ncbi:hypothetical protein AKJ54_00865, partial [candidate division MSBL1 archaeon SCGC-AAA382K21]